MQHSQTTLNSKETRLVCQQRAQHTLPAACHHVCPHRGRSTPHQRKEHARPFCSLFTLSIIKHRGRSKQEETRHQTTYHKHLRNGMSSSLPVSCLQFIFLQVKYSQLLQTTKFKLRWPPSLKPLISHQFPSSTSSVETLTIICRLQGMLALPSLALGVCVSSLHMLQLLHKKHLSTSVLLPH